METEEKRASSRLKGINLLDKFKKFKLKKLNFKKEKNPGADSKIKRGSIRGRLLLLPITIVVLVILGIGVASTYNTRASLLDEMHRNEAIILDEFINRMNDNQRALTTINKSIEDEIRAAANAAHSDRNFLGLDLSGDKDINNTVVDGTSHASEKDYGSDNIPVYNVIYPALINNKIIGAMI